LNERETTPRRAFKVCEFNNRDLWARGKTLACIFCERRSIFCKKRREPFRYHGLFALSLS